jgi:hypothetical protein
MARHNKTFKLCEVHSAATGKRDWCYEAWTGAAIYQKWIW